MASRQSVRQKIPVVRYGIDSDISDDESELSDEDASDNSVNSGDEDSADSESLDENPHTLENNNDGWECVQPVDNCEETKFDFVGEQMLHVVPQSTEEFIDLFLPESLISELCAWTNSRALIEKSRRQMNSEDDFQWNDVDVPTMKKFLGLTILMGIVKKPTIRSYWSTDSLLATPYFSHPSSLSRDRYLAILRFLRFSNPYNAEENRPQTRLKDFLDEVKTICSVFRPGQSLAVDESLLLFKGRLSFKIFIRTKRSRFGVKLFILTTDAGYFISCVVYTGSSTDYTCTEPGCENLSKSELVVVALLSEANLLDQGYIVNIDNWYNSIRLVHYLQQRNTGVRGTVRKNRGIPECLQNTKLLPVKSAYFKKNNVIAIKFVDKQDVYFLTSADSASEVEKQRRKPGGQSVTIKKPTAIERYNKEMGGIDVEDQLITTYNCVRKAHCWFKKVGFNIIMRLLLNGFILDKHRGTQKVDFLMFLKKAVQHLTSIPSTQRTQSGRKRIILEELQTNPPHSLERIPSTDKKLNPTKRCRLCFRKGHRKESRYQCSVCEERPGLCIGCFQEYHA